MMEERVMQVRVGLFVAAGCIVAAIIIFMLGSERAWFERKYELRSRFTDINGLVVGAPVNLAGLKVGFVGAIRFPAQADEKEIEVIIKVGRAYHERIRKDSEAAIHTQGLLGDKFINLTMGSPAEPSLQPGEYLITREERGFAELVARGSEMMDHLEDAAASVKKFIEGRSDNSLAHALLYDPRGKVIVDDLAGTLRSVRRFTGDLDKEVGGAQLSKIITNLHKSAEDIQAVTGQVRRGEGTVGGLLTDPAIYNDLRTLFGRANRNFLLRAIVRSTLRANEQKVSEE